MARPSDTLGKRRIVIVGGGAGGLELAVRLGRASRSLGACVTLVDGNLSHIWKPRLHELAVGLNAPGGGEVSYLALSRSNDFQFEWGSMKGLDTLAKKILLAKVAGHAEHKTVLDERTLEYDDLVLCIGSRVNDFGIPGVAEHAYCLDGPEDAHVLHRALIEAGFRVAGDATGPVKVAIVGAGATGVELAAELKHAEEALSMGIRSDISSPLEISLIDASSRVLAAVDEATSQFTQDFLASRGINLLLGKRVIGVSAQGVHLESGLTVASDITIWASGVIGHEVTTALAQLTLVRGRRIAVDAYLACSGVNDVFALGDCAAGLAADGSPTLPQTAQVAHQQADYLFQQFKRRARHQRPEVFTYSPKGTLVSLGGWQASGEFPKPVTWGGQYHLNGFASKIAYVMLAFMHQVALRGWIAALLLFLSDAIRGIVSPPVKLH